MVMQGSVIYQENLELCRRVNIMSQQKMELYRKVWKMMFCRNFNQINMRCQQKAKLLNFSSRLVKEEVLLMQIQALALPTALILHKMQMSHLILDGDIRTKKRGNTVKQGHQNWGKYNFLKSRFSYSYEYEES